MTTMPVIDDRKVDLFRRTGKRRASYRPAQGGRAAAAAQRVLLQRSPGCFSFGQPCKNSKGQPGFCDADLDCILDFNPGPGPFKL
ncbi:MAG TPA: hypothetical protein VGO01_17850 [Bradyrhizobium sp.]|jgi:hypothetical protein|nr:hypothetical protein [Bradyrhizobium sp.]